jgi:hypothetical protein
LNKYTDLSTILVNNADTFVCPSDGRIVVNVKGGVETETKNPFVTFSVNDLFMYSARGVNGYGTCGVTVPVLKNDVIILNAKTAVVGSTLTRFWFIPNS